MTGQAATTVSWTYTWIAHGSPSTTIKVRATDDSGNIATPGAGTTVNVDCPCSLWGTNVTPATADAGRRHRHRGRRQVQVRRLRPGQRHPLLQVGDQHRHPHRQPVELATARCWRRPRSPTRAPPDGRPSRSPARCRSSRTPPMSPATTHRSATTPPPTTTSTPTRRRRRWAEPASTRRPLHALNNNATRRQRRVRLRLVEHVPDADVPSGQLLGRRDVRADDRARPGDQRHGHGRQGLGDDQLDRAQQRRPGDLLQDHPVHRLDGADADDDQRHAARHQHHDLGPDPGRVLHVHGAGVQPDRQRRGLGSVQRGHAAGQVGAHRAHEHRRQRRIGLGRGQLDRPQRRRRQPDHRLQGHAVHRHHRADARQRRRRQDQRVGHRPDQRHHLHVHGDCHQRDRLDRVRALRGDLAQRHDLRPGARRRWSTAWTPATSTSASSSRPAFRA